MSLNPRHSLFLLCIFLLSACSPGGKTVVLQTPNGPYTVRVEVARTGEEKARGLMFRQTLPRGQGMLFEYEEALRPSFWMKNTFVPLDMLFIDSEGVIRDIAPLRTPCPAQGECPSYTSKALVQFVLEIPAGETERLSLSVGDRAEPWPPEP